jgi:hypothetical protein
VDVYRYKHKHILHTQTMPKLTSGTENLGSVWFGVNEG